MAMAIMPKIEDSQIKARRFRLVIATPSLLRLWKGIAQKAYHWWFTRFRSANSRKTGLFCLSFSKTKVSKNFICDFCKPRNLEYLVLYGIWNKCWEFQTAQINFKFRFYRCQWLAPLSPFRCWRLKKQSFSKNFSWGKQDFFQFRRVSVRACADTFRVELPCFKHWEHTKANRWFWRDFEWREQSKNTSSHFDVSGMPFILISLKHAKVAVRVDVRLTS